MTEQSLPDTGITTSPDTGTSTSPDTGNTVADTGTDTTDWKAEAEKFRELHRKQEARAKANADASKELDRLRREVMTEQERAVAEASEKARTEAVTEVTGRLGSRLVIAEIRAAVAGRLTDEQVGALVDHLDLGRFITGEGDVDSKAVADFTASIAPESTGPPSFPDLGQGARPLAAGNGAPDPLMRDLMGKLGIAT
jgi:hypothetical protein